jgi:hypothetical protein
VPKPPSPSLFDGEKFFVAADMILASYSGRLERFIWLLDPSLSRSRVNDNADSNEVRPSPGETG